ncbi:hypothetical protein FRC09_003243 [Ceratobasidium sp. 395]|nr:hypothetical protein FRC09_003243 [Ceratobasidium sp. 395]
MAGETSNTDNTQPSTLLDFSTGQFDPGFPANESTSVLLATLDRYSVGSSSGLAELAPPIDSGKDIGIDTNTIVLSHDAPRTGPLPVQYDQMITLVYFKPPSRQATRTRNSLIKRIEKSDTARLTVFIGYQLLQSLIKGGSAEKISFYTNWLGQLEQQSSASTSDPNLTPAEYQNRLSSMLELAFLRFGLANQSTSVYRLLLDCAPVFLQMALMEGAWQPNSSSVSVARLFASTRHELVQFVLQDSLCSMLYALPQAVDYDTSIQPSGEERHIVEWVYGCPAEFQVALVDMNAHIHHKPGKNIDWQLMEQSLKSWKPTALDREGESWKAVARLAVHESWRHTLLIYLYMASLQYHELFMFVPNIIRAGDARVQASVRQVFRLTSAVKPPEVPTINIHLFVQYIVAGACARDEKRRAIAREKLRFEFIKELMILRGSNFVPVLDHLWHGAAANGRPIRWSDFVKSRQTAHPILI